MIIMPPFQAMTITVPPHIIAVSSLLLVLRWTMLTNGASSTYWISYVPPQAATGLDGLPTFFRRLGAPVFCKPVAYFFNISISTAPVQWKQARIPPVPKLSNPKQHADYRPISVTPVLARVMEKTAVMLVLGLGPGLKDSLRTRTKSLVLALALRVKSLVLVLALLSPW